MLARIAAVAINTFREAVRDRVLYGVLGMALAVLLFSLALAEVSLNQHVRVVLDVGLASISLFSVIVAIFLGSSLLYKEIERKTLYVVLPKPIRRVEFLVGKYLGIALTAATFVMIMGAVQLWVAAVQGGASALWLVASILGLPALLALAAWRARDRTALLMPWSALSLAACAAVAGHADIALGPVLAALALSVGEVLVLAAVALLFSSFSTPFLTALLTAGVWLAGRAADDMATMSSKLLPAWITAMLRALAEVVPNFNLFVPGRHTLETMLTETVGPLSYVATSLGYAVAYAVVMLAAAAFIFQRRDFL